ncbi:GroES-like protein [Aspergillus bertholletiae]|uniref:GroES-like protein n=1 Tax=Aspergillus bertholletiae TaxID=1226010 RepID=A0A5N7B148_9EURO|nr:GroES-like protein [Aspergillus bertholletiae]
MLSKYQDRDHVRAYRYHGNKDIRLETIPVQGDLKEGEIRLSPAWCGICGTDVHEYLHGPVVPPTKENPHPLTGETMPIILGHEFSGTVTEVHPSVDLKVGSFVAVEGLLTDNSCYACIIRKRNICDQSAFLGLSANPGGLCESIVIPASMCHVLPDGMGLEAGALIEPLAVAWHAVSNAGIKAGQSAIVFGAGPIGLAVMLCLRAKGISHILVSEPSMARHAQAITMGAGHVFDPTKVDVSSKAKEICDGIGPDFAFDASGVQATITEGIKAIRKYGMYYNIALWSAPAIIDMHDMVYYGKTIKSDLSFSKGDFESVIDAINRGLITHESLNSMITSRIELEELEEKGIQELIKNKEQHVKILIRVDRTQPMPEDA